MIFGPPQSVQLRLAHPAAPGTTGLRVLLLHGLASGSSVWDPFAARVNDDCELWSADLPWRGGGVPGWAERSGADWIDQVVAAVPGGPQVVVGHSFGAGALLSWLDRNSAAAERLAGVVLVSPFYRPRSQDFTWETLAYYFTQFHRILDDGLRVSSGGWGNPEVRHGIALKVQERIGAYGWVRFFDTYLATPRLRTDRLRTPFLIVGGEQDFAALPADARALAAALPDAEVVILPDVGHFSLVERAAEFAAATNGFLRSVSRRLSSGTAALAMERI